MRLGLIDDFLNGVMAETKNEDIDDLTRKSLKSVIRHSVERPKTAAWGVQFRAQSWHTYSVVRDGVRATLG
jgi:hypothetical protein